MPQSAQGPGWSDGAMGRHAPAWVDTVRGQVLPTLPGLQACRGCILAGPVCAA